MGCLSVAVSRQLRDLGRVTQVATYEKRVIFLVYLAPAGRHVYRKAIKPLSKAPAGRHVYCCVENILDVQEKYCLNTDCFLGGNLG